MQKILPEQLLNYLSTLPGCQVQTGLYIVATPIGHLSDISLRALAVLAQVDIIACEDTRVVSKLLQRFSIARKTLLSYHSHNENQSTNQIIEHIKNGQSVALVSDAGTPLISDPGFDIVTHLVEGNLPLTSIPGPCAAICALTLSGFPLTEFVFLGFLNRKSNARLTALKNYSNSSLTIVLYEAPHRLIQTLEDIFTVLGNREIMIGRELTKRFEEITRGTASEVIQICKQKSPKGEYVLIIKGSKVVEKEVSDDLIKELLENQTSKDVLKVLMNDYLLPKQLAYKRILAIKESKN
jgi:16S rRNA (cytidine1402-2'-O)-methyltransferase